MGSSLTGTAVSGAMCTAFGCTAFGCKVCGCKVLGGKVWGCVVWACSRGNTRGMAAGDQPNAEVTLAAAAATSPPFARARHVWTARLASWMFSRNASSEW